MYRGPVIIYPTIEGEKCIKVKKLHEKNASFFHLKKVCKKIGVLWENVKIFTGLIAYLIVQDLNFKLKLTQDSQLRAWWF